MTKDAEVITIQFDESKIVFQKWIELYVALGGQIIDSSFRQRTLVGHGSKL